MAFWDSWGGKDSSQEEELWEVLETQNQWEQLLKASHTRDQWVFKHSGACGISLSVKRRLEDRLTEWTADSDRFILDVIGCRELSRQVAGDLERIHQSPQLIIVRGGKSIWDASHYDILDFHPDTLNTN